MSNEQEGKGRHNASPDEETDLRWWMICYASTSEGYFTNDLWIDIIAKFIDLISPVKGDLSVFSTLYLPAHSSHIIQPLDDVPFALKRIGCQTRDKLTLGRQIRRESLDNVTQEAILIAEKKTFTTYIIKAGFARTGVWPTGKRNSIQEARHVHDRWRGLKRNEEIKKTAEMKKAAKTEKTKGKGTERALRESEFEDPGPKESQDEPRERSTK
jgi:hypothetical protein